jgi:hypothetical protein
MLSTTLQYIGQLYNMTLLRHLAEMQVPEAYTLNNKGPGDAVCRDEAESEGPAG